MSLDNIREELDVDPTDNQGQVAQLAKEKCREFLRAGTSSAFKATNTMKETRGRWLDLFSDYNAINVESEVDRIPDNQVSTN